MKISAHILIQDDDGQWISAQEDYHYEGTFIPNVGDLILSSESRLPFESNKENLMLGEALFYRVNERVVVTETYKATNRCPEECVTKIALLCSKTFRNLTVHI